MEFEIAISEPCLVVLVGVAGSGKSTFAARHFAADEVLASDAFRARLGRDEADQGATRKAFGVLHAALERRLAAGRTTVVDATNVRPEARRALVRRAAAVGLPAIAIVLDLPLAECLAGDRMRLGRHVPAAIVERQFAELRAALAGPVGAGAAGRDRLGYRPTASTMAARFADEGFAAAHRLGSRAEVDSVVLRRVAGGWPTLSRATRVGRRSRGSVAPERHSRTDEDVERA
jgi:predicted kinase